MSLYPSLEDMQLDKMIQAQHMAMNQIQATSTTATSPAPIAPPAYTMNPYPELVANQPPPSSSIAQRSSAEMYPGLSDFMGLELSQDVIAANMPEYLKDTTIVAARPTNVIDSRLNGMIAPITGTSQALQRAQVTNGVRELILCKGADRKVGLRVKEINKGIFVTIVVKNSPAAMAGLRFGDQILQINGKVVAGSTMDDIHSLLKKSASNNISIIVRDRPFERAITLHKDSKGRIGFQFNGGRINALVKDSSAAKNGVLIDHQLLEINGQNVVGMKDKEITAIIDGGGQVIAITIIPSFIYDHMMKKLSSSFIRGIMDHSTPADF